MIKLVEIVTRPIMITSLLVVLVEYEVPFVLPK